MVHAAYAGTKGGLGSGAHSDARLFLLGGFALEPELESVPVAPASQRLLAFLALAGPKVRRDVAAGVLWPEASEAHAHANLRAALARLRACASSIVSANRLEIGLAGRVRIDLHDGQATARQLLAGAQGVSSDTAAAAIACLSTELLPGWYDDWILLEAESWRQLRLHALEVVAGVLAQAGRFGEALIAAHAAVEADPLRESPHASLITIHLSEGNQSEAMREFQRYRLHLSAELGIEPTPRLRSLLPF
jgi:SARP family transcriptional regulator, regulator of embCAB operon